MIIFLAKRGDLVLQHAMKIRAERKWLRLGEPPLTAGTKKWRERVKSLAQEFKSALGNFAWSEICDESVIQRAVSHGLRHGFAITQIGNEGVCLAVKLTGRASKVRTSSWYKTLVWLQHLAFATVVLAMTGESTTATWVMLAYFVIGVVELSVWCRINPSLSLAVRRTGERGEVEASIQRTGQKYLISGIDEACIRAAALIADLDPGSA